LEIELRQGQDRMEKKDKEDESNNAYALYVYAMRSPGTKDAYLRRLRNGDRLVESASTDEYQIDGHDTGSFLYTSNPASSLGLDSLTSFDTANLVLFVNNDDEVYTLKYSDDVDDFDTPEGEEIRNHILNSFHFKLQFR
jgi:hypothetical protein